MTRTSPRIQAFFDALDIRPSDRILEVGCGQGVLASLICERLAPGVGFYLAIDRSKAMIEAATRRNRRFIEGGVAVFQISDFETLDLGSQTFDKVVAMRVRWFHDHPEDAHRHARRWLAPSGKVHVVYDEPEAKPLA